MWFCIWLLSLSMFSELRLENVWAAYIHCMYAVAAAKSLQSCPTLCDPIYGSPPGSPIPGILQARILEWVAISFSNAWKWKVKVKSFSRVWLFANPWTACSPPGSSDHGIFQARVLEWGAVIEPGPSSIHGPLNAPISHRPKSAKLMKLPRVLSFCFNIFNSFK